MRFYGLLNKEREIYSETHDGKTITITEKGRLRILKCNGIIFSKISSGMLFVNEYWDFFIPLAYFYEKPEILMIGIGGGTIPFQLGSILNDRMDMVAVEPDQHMVAAYTKFLDKMPHLKIENAEGSEYISEKKSSYDIIILDAYDQTGKIPLQFHNKEFVSNAYESLKEKGVLAINCIGSMLGPELDLFIQNYSEKFEVYRLDTSYHTANIILICLKNISKETLIHTLEGKMQNEKDKEFLFKAYLSSKRVFITT